MLPTSITTEATERLPQRDLSSIHTYLTVGFVPCVERASAYLDRILAPCDGSSPAEAPQLLRQIVEDLTWAKGHREVAIPLTGGNDSRALLGAALEVFDAGAIHCFTVGVRSFSDCVDAAAACRRVGVRHERVESNDLEWDIDELTRKARDRFNDTGSCVTLGPLVAFGALARRIGDDVPVLAGFMGDAVSGKHLPLKNGQLSDTPVELSFLAANRSILDGIASPTLRDLFAAFARRHADRLKGWSGATPFDLLDFGFRQSHYIRPNSAAYRSVVRPFEDPRWVQHWLARPLADRLAQQAYVGEMHRGFSSVFGQPVANQSARRVLARTVVPRRVRRWLRKRVLGEQLTVEANRGDPRVNRSMAKALEQLLGAFDRRQLLPTPTLPVLRALQRRFDGDSFHVIRWASAAEIHLRAGNLTAEPVDA